MQPLQPRSRRWRSISAVCSGLTSGSTSGYILCRAEGRGVGAYRYAASGEERLHGYRRRRRQGRESQPRTRPLRGVRQHLHLSRPGWHGGGQDPVAGMRIALSDGALRSGQGYHLEPGMPVQQLHEALSHRAGRAQHGNRDG